MALDPDTIHLTRHAVSRYLERRNWPASYAYTVEAEHKLRDLLDRCATQNPPLRWSQGRACRRYQTGGNVFVVDPDNTTVITFLALDQGKRRRRKQAVRA